MMKFLYIFEGNEIKVIEQDDISEEDALSVDSGVLTIIRYFNNTFQEYNPEEGWVEI